MDLESSEKILTMEMECDSKTLFRKDRRCSRRNGIVLILGSVSIIIFIVMVFVIVAQQERRFSMLENWIKTHVSNLTSVKSEPLISEMQQNISNSEMKILKISLISSLSALTSKLNDAVTHQERKFSMLENWMYTHISNMTSLKSQLQITEMQQNMSYTEVKSLSSSLSALTFQLNDAVTHQERKFSMLENWMNTHISNMTSLKSQLQITGGNLENKVTELQNSVSSRVSPLGSLISKLAENVQSLEIQQNMSNTEVKSLSSSMSALTFQLNDAVTHQERKFSMLENWMNTHISNMTSLKSQLQITGGNLEKKVTELQNSVSSRVSPLGSLISKLAENVQSLDERLMNALNELKTKISTRKTDTPELSCKSGWFPFFKSCYLFSKNTLNWSEARDYCKGQGAQLLKLEDDDDREWKFVTNYINPTHYWVGLTDQVTGQWRWADDTPYIMNKERWNPGQPDNWSGHGLGEGGEDCGHITWKRKLNDIHCSDKMNYICKV